MTREEADRWYRDLCPGGEGHEGGLDGVGWWRGDCHACIVDALSDPRASASPDARPAPSARRAMRDAAEVLEEQARTAEGRLVGAESDPDCDEGTVNVLRREAAKWREPADALRAALDAAPSAREEGLRARVEALVYGPRPTLDEWLDPCGKAGLVRSALASAPASVPERATRWRCSAPGTPGTWTDVPERATDDGRPSWMPGGAFCDCGHVEFMVPGSACVRTETRGTGPTQHTPTECRASTNEELRNLDPDANPQ